MKLPQLFLAGNIFVRLPKRNIVTEIICFQLQSWIIYIWTFVHKYGGRYYNNGSRYPLILHEQVY